MSRNTAAIKRGWNYDQVNSVLSLMVDGVEVASFSSTAMTWNISPLTLSYPLTNTGAVTNSTTLLQTGVATFTDKDVHNGGLSIATAKPFTWPATDTAGASATLAGGGAYTMSKADGVCTLTLPNPVVAGDIYIIGSKSAEAHKVHWTEGTFDGTNHYLDFAAAIGNAVIFICVSTTLALVIGATGVTVAAS